MLTQDLRFPSVHTEGFVNVSDPTSAAPDRTDAARVSSPVGLHRVLEPTGDAITLPQAAQPLDASPKLWPDEVRIAVETLNLDAASYRQLAEKHGTDGTVDGAAVRAEVLDIVATRGKMQNPVTGSGGMLIGTVEEVGPDSTLGLAVGDRIATLVSLSLTPLAITDGLARWDGLSEQVPAEGHAILFGRSIAATLPTDLDPHLALMVMDVCGAPAPVERERTVLEGSGLADAVVLADARSPLGLAAAVESAGGPADVTVVCVDVPGCEQPAILATAQGGTIIFFSMATNFAAAALGAEGLAADVRMIVGNGYVPGHAETALRLVREVPAVRALFEGRLAAETAGSDA